jgi:uncharacterized protein (TIGR02145 family)
MSMRTRYDLNALFLLFTFFPLALPGAVTVAEAQVQPELAKRYFEEATKLCERDAGRLWGVSLCGPMVIFDVATRTHATSQPEPEGPPPRFPAYADGPVTWGGVQWFAFPLHMLPEKDPDARQQNMLHGLFHRIQPGLTFTKGNGNGFNEHLHTLEGRVWMQLEWRALRRAVESSGSDRAEAIADALAFRSERRRRFPGAADDERRDEIREGLASYTGIAVWASSPADARRAAASALGGGESQTSFVGNFEAASGPAYGVLLDDLLPEWRRQLRGTSDLGDMLASAIKKPAAKDVAAAAARYDGATLRSAEEARDRAQAARVAELRQRFVDGPVLTMPAGGSGTSDTTGSVGIPGVGTVLFRNFTLSAKWGSFEANNGVLRAADGNTLSVPVTGRLEGTALRGEGWTATLNSGWVVGPAARPGSFVIVRESAQDRNVSNVSNAADSKRMPDGKQWLAANLSVPIDQSYCFDDAEAQCRRYGRLYTWESARRGCQSLGDGWRLPTDDEWRELAKHYGGVYEDEAHNGKAAFAALLTGGASGFNALLGGNRDADNGQYARLEAHGIFWTATETEPGKAWFYNFGKGSQTLYRQRGGNKQMAVSARCVKD